jgi:hypothetical protein
VLEDSLGNSGLGSHLGLRYAISMQVDKAGECLPDKNQLMLGILDHIYIASGEVSPLEIGTLSHMYMWI